MRTRAPWIHVFILIAFLANILGPMPLAQAQLASPLGSAGGAGGDFRLPAPGVRVHLSPEFNPPLLKGIKVHPDNPFRFDFILDKGDSSSLVKGGDRGSLKQEATKLIKYFLASLTIPEKDLWVNLSPYEKDRIIPQSFGLTEMGRDLLAEDYMLKQITASLIYPEDEIGKKFWKRIYEEAQKKFGTTNIPVNTFNKVWIVPEKAVVYENVKAGTAYIVESRLKVMLEEDYLALEKNQRQPGDMLALPIRGHVPEGDVSSSRLPSNEAVNVKASQGNHPNAVQATSALGSQIVREIVIPELTKEVNENKNFAKLRQVYNSLILATWYKKKIKDSILAQVYADKNKVAGVQYTSTVIPAKAGINFKNDVEGLYQEYLKAFKKGVYNYIKEEQDPLTQQIIPRKYFSGGVALSGLTGNTGETNIAVAPIEEYTEKISIEDQDKMPGNDRAMIIQSRFIGAQLSETQEGRATSWVPRTQPPLVQRSLGNKIRPAVPVVHPFVRITNEGLFHGQKRFRDAGINTHFVQRLRQEGIDFLVGEGLNDKNFISGLSQYQGSDLRGFLERRSVSAISIPINVPNSQPNIEEAREVFKPILDPIMTEDPQFAEALLPLFIDFLSKMSRERDLMGSTSIDRFKYFLYAEEAGIELKQQYALGKFGEMPAPLYSLLSFIVRWNYVANEILKDVGRDREAISPLMDPTFVYNVRFFDYAAEYRLNKLLADWRHFGQKQNVKVFLRLGAWGSDDTQWESFLELSKKMKERMPITFNEKTFTIESIDERESDYTKGGGTGKSPIFEMTLRGVDGEQQRVLVKWMVKKNIGYDIIGAQVAGILNVPTYHVAQLESEAAAQADEAWAMIEYRESDLIALQTKNGFLTPGLAKVLSGTPDAVKERMRSLGAAVGVSDILDSRDAMMKHFLLTAEGFIRIDQEYMFGDVPDNLRQGVVSWDKGDVNTFLKVIVGRQGNEDYIDAFLRGFEETRIRARERLPDILNSVSRHISHERFEAAKFGILQRLNDENRRAVIERMGNSTQLDRGDRAMISSKRIFTYSALLGMLLVQNGSRNQVFRDQLLPLSQQLVSTTAAGVNMYLYTEDSTIPFYGEGQPWRLTVFPDHLYSGLQAVYLPLQKEYERLNRPENSAGFFVPSTREVVLGERGQNNGVFSHEVFHNYWQSVLDEHAKEVLTDVYTQHRESFLGLTEMWEDATYAYKSNSPQEAFCEVARLWVSDPEKVVSLYNAHKELAPFIGYVAKAFSWDKKGSTTGEKTVRLYYFPGSGKTYGDYSFPGGYGLGDVMSQLETINTTPEDAPSQFYSEGSRSKVKIGSQEGRADSILTILRIYFGRHHLKPPSDLLSVLDFIEEHNPGIELGHLDPGDIIDLTGVDDFIEHQSSKKEDSAGYKNQAMKTEKGGIDFTTNKTPLEVQNTGEGIKFHLDPGMLQQLQNAPGFVPVIISVQPLKGIAAFLGLNQGQ